MSKFYNKLIGIADQHGNGYSGTKEEKHFLDDILKGPGFHPKYDYDEAAHYKSLSKDERDNNLDAMRYKNIWG